MEELLIDTEGSMSKCAVTPVIVGDCKIQVIIPLEGLVDIEEEVKRLQKAVEKTTKDIGILSGRLSNENFVKNAAEDVVEADRLQLTSLQQQLKAMQEALVRLQ